MNLSLPKYLLDAVEQPLLIVDASGEIIFGNRKLLIDVQCSTEYLHRKHISAFFTKIPEDLFNLSTWKANKAFSTQIKSEREIFIPTMVKASKVEGDEGLILFQLEIESKDEGIDQLNLYKILAENAYDINLIFSRGDLIYVSPSIEDLLGYKAEEICKFSDWLETIHVANRNEILSFFQKVENGSEENCTLLYRQRHKNGNFCWMETKCSIDTEKDVPYVILTSMDVSQQVEAERLLDQQKNFMTLLFDANPDLIMVKDGEGNIIFCNQSLAELTGKSKEEIYKNGLLGVKITVDENTIVPEQELEVLQKGNPLLNEEQITSEKGLVSFYQTRRMPLQLPDGKNLLLTISTNIDKVKHYQQESEKALKLRTEFFSVMSHEIKTPLNALMGMAELLIQRKPRKDQFKLLQTIHFSARNLVALVNDVLDFSKIEAGMSELEDDNVNLYELLDHIRLSYRPKAAAKKVDLKLHIDEKVPRHVKGDIIKLSQVFNNLVSNAVKFTEKGTVEIKVSLKQETDDLSHIKFVIKDTGVGIPKDKLSMIFEPFKQALKSTNRMYGGTGLGLSIVKNLVDLHKGTIEVKSEEGKGTIFTLVLPLQKNGDWTKSNKAIEALASLGRIDLDIDVLYVEDVTTNQFLIEELLSEWGVRVDLASDGFQALRKIENRNYDLVLMDIQMPGIDGYETARRIRKKKGTYFNEVPIIALTASDSDKVWDQLETAGIQDCICKPINIDQLRQKISTYTGKMAVPLQASSENGQEVSGEHIFAETVDFSWTDHLFQDNLLRYQDFLKKTLEEFTINLENIFQAIDDHNLDHFRQIYHKMKSIINMLKLRELQQTMDELKERLANNDLLEKEKKEIREYINVEFEKITDPVNNKLSSLKWYDFKIGNPS
ncbi:MAG: response regulator [Cyclobacteriaceae bacterium]|nr:response regulator [Cyclobacteriaceae bacterium]